MGFGCGCGSPLDCCLLNLCARVDDGLHCILIPLQTRASKTHGARFRVERARERGGFRVESARARTQYCNCCNYTSGEARDAEHQGHREWRGWERRHACKGTVCATACLRAWSSVLSRHIWICFEAFIFCSWFCTHRGSGFGVRV